MNGAWVPARAACQHVVGGGREWMGTKHVQMTWQMVEERLNNGRLSNESRWKGKECVVSWHACRSHTRVGMETRQRVRCASGSSLGALGSVLSTGGGASDAGHWAVRCCAVLCCAVIGRRRMFRAGSLREAAMEVAGGDAMRWGASNEAED